MEIIHVAAELAPIAKVGGMGDVLHGLSRALMEKEHTVTVILPKYDTLDLKQVKDLKVFANQTIPFGDRVCQNVLWRGTMEEIPIIFVEAKDQDFFRRKAIYGFPDDVARFTYFCLSALEYLRKTPCDVVHVHDWHTAALAGLIKEKCPEIKASVVLTIHNLAYQGFCWKSDLDKLKWHSELLREADGYSLLKGGIIFADKVTTVSPTYAREIVTPEYGGNLQKTLVTHQAKLSGILNGIDYDYWNPATDPILPFHYSADALANKEKVKEELKKKFSLANEKSPLVCAITRLVPQKGPEFIKAALLRTLEWGGQFVLLGSAPDEATQFQFTNLQKKFAGSQHVHLELKFNEELSHLVFAASDLILVPSLFEPCGLTQMIGMHYGTIPLARACGGLADTVLEGQNGFVFGPPTLEAFHSALDRALATWHKKPAVWRDLMHRGMLTDFSWHLPADAYVDLYKSIKVPVAAGGKSPSTPRGV